MKISANCIDGKLRINLYGELDHHSAKELMKKISRSIDDYLPRVCILDFSELTFMDSSGIAIILRVYRKMRDCEGTAWVENPQRQPLKVIDAAGIDRIVSVKCTAKEGER